MSINVLIKVKPRQLQLNMELIMNLLPTIKEIKQEDKSIITREYLLLIDNELNKLVGERDRYIELYINCDRCRKEYRQRMRKYEWIDNSLRFLLSLPRKLFRRSKRILSGRK
tara:strand:- start:195 stop:530 length:336 start_codon:yes stop_codon:yes gene_type:complete